MEYCYNKYLKNVEVALEMWNEVMGRGCNSFEVHARKSLAMNLSQLCPLICGRQNLRAMN